MGMTESIKQTPMMNQYLRFKRQYPDKVVLFRMGDFFETFGEDAKIASKVLNITLTTRDKKTNPTPLAGFPHKALDQYLPKLVNSGYNVVIVDQLEDPKLAKGIVKRGVTRIVTPGTLEQEDGIKSNYICSFSKIKKDLGVTICDILTGEVFSISLSFSKESIENILSSFDPSEILLIEDEKELQFPTIPIQFLSKGLKNIKYAEELIKEFYNISNLQSLDLDFQEPNICSLAMILQHIQDTQLMDPVHIKKPKKKNILGNMILDQATVRNLELVRNSYSGDIQDSLFSVIDFTSTLMGRRLLYSWLLNPLIQRDEIEDRLNMVDIFYNDSSLLKVTKEILSDVNDIERLVGKIGLARVNGRDLKALQTSLESIQILLKEFSGIKELKNLLSGYKNSLSQIISSIDNCIVDNPPTLLSEGGIIKSSYNDNVKELRELSGDSKTWIKEFEKKEKESTQIPSLKIGYNKVFGYYIEVTRAHQSKVPERYIRKQTLVNSERYITEELKEREDVILNAQEKLNELEYQLFNEFRESLLQYIPILQELSTIIAKTDVLSGFAKLATEREYVKPKIYDMGENDGIIDIKGGRHPLVEVLSEEEFISNNSFLDSVSTVLSILTGPNMSGKSTYIRQVATLVLLAQIGCYVPAKSMTLSLVDRIFTRVGASDDLSKGRSTFMVEMDEAANIVNNATKYSLIVLDEVGRGTSTYDGVSIAWALAEYLVNELKARTLFATHYHELIKLSERIPSRVKNYNVLVEEDLTEGTVIFLRKIIEGGTDRSYGIYVAKMAGLPETIIGRAKEILEGFEQEQMFVLESKVREGGIIDTEKSKNNTDPSHQFSLFVPSDSEIEKEIQDIDIDNITPIEALSMIAKWKKKI